MRSENENNGQAQLRRILAYRTPLWHPDMPFILAWCQKAGCTFGVKWFFWQLGLLEEALRFDPWVHVYENQVYYQQEGYRETVLREIAEKDRPYVKLIRNPYDRAVSAFLIFAYQPSSLPHWSIRTYAQLEQLTQHAGLSFHDMLRVVGTRSPYDLDPHITPQLQPGEVHAVDRVVFLEDAKQGFPALEAEFGLAAAPITQLRQSGHDKLQAARWDERESLPATPRPFGWLGERLAPPYTQFLDEEARALIHEAYADDFELAARFGRDYRAEIQPADDGPI